MRPAPCAAALGTPGDPGRPRPLPSLRALALNGLFLTAQALCLGHRETTWGRAAQEEEGSRSGRVSGWHTGRIATARP